VNARVADEQPLSDNEVIAVLQQLVTAGNDTTTSAMGMGMLMLIQNPDKADAVRADMSKIPNMVEEMLRFESPAAGTWRIAQKDIELEGVQIPAQSLVMVRLAAANRDQNVFENPDEFDPHRRNAHRHFTFGRGIHTCIGNMLARREMAIAFEEIFKRMSNIRLADEDPVYDVTVMSRGIGSMKILFDAVENG
jgi:cytochrome P450